MYAHLFFSKPWAHTHDIDYITLHYANVGKMTSAQRLELLAFSLTLLLLLCEAFVAIFWFSLDTKDHVESDELFLVDRLELNSVV